MTRVWSDRQNVSDESRVGVLAPQGTEVGRVGPSEDLPALVPASFHRGPAVEDAREHAEAAHGRRASRVDEQLDELPAGGGEGLLAEAEASHRVGFHGGLFAHNWLEIA